MFRLIRSILPVGQGAFYCEKFSIDDEKPRTIVYDCGTWTAPRAKTLPRYFAEEIDGMGKQGDDIDVLFISHFDKDHVNGIERLNARYNIKNIVLPEITPNLWYLYALGVYTGQYDAMTSFISFIQDNIGKLIEVQPANEGGEFDAPNDLLDLSTPEPVEEDDGTRGNGNRHKQTIQSGTRIKVSAIADKLYWCYKPLNYEVTSQTIDNLKKLIIAGLAKINVVVTEDDFNDLDKVKNAIVIHQKEIKEGFARCGIETNKSSMIVYSGPSAAIDAFAVVSPYMRYVYWYFYRGQWSCKSACLYTGDSELEDNRYKSIIAYLDGLLPNIGTIQIPHHGSNKNITIDDIPRHLGLNLNEILCFASYGKKNIYHHPSFSIVADLFFKKSPLWGVTEDKNTQLNETVII